MTADKAHKARVLKVQSILWDLCNGRLSVAKAEIDLVKAGLDAAGAARLIQTAKANLIGVA